MSEIELLPCPFCDQKPIWKQDKIYYCQLHGEPSQSMIIFCNNSDCFSKPKVTAGDCYNHTKAEGFNVGKQKALKKAAERWNTRAITPNKDSQESFRANLQRNQEIFDMGVEHKGGHKDDSREIEGLREVNRALLNVVKELNEGYVPSWFQKTVDLAITKAEQALVERGSL